MKLGANATRLEYASHQRTLVAAVMRTTGPVLELGAGFFSTPLLHEICRAQRRLFLALENNLHWGKRFHELDDPHPVVHVGAWDLAIEIDEGGWSVVFIDHEPTERRAIDLERVRKAGGVRYVVVHDTEPGARHMYPGLEEALSAFAFRRDFSELEPWTSVVSDVGPIWRE